MDSTPMSSEYASENKGPRILAVFWSFTSLASIVVAARFWIRTKVLRNAGVDDWLIVLSMGVSILYTVVTTVNVHLGYGKHSAVIADRLETVLLINNVDFTFGILSFCLPKLAVVALLTRLLNLTRMQRLVLWGLTSLVAVTSLALILVLFTMCNPPKALWEVHLLAEGATCRDIWILIDYAIFVGALSAFTDLYLAVYPTVILMKLNMSLRKRLALCLALGLGAIASAVAIVKCFQLPGLADLSDSTYSTADLVLWTSIESNVVILASCIPTLQPLIEIIMGKRALSSSYRYKNSGNVQESYSWTRQSAATRKDLMVTNVESQQSQQSRESILPEEVETETSGAHEMGQIRRTDKVIIEYGSPPSRWCDNKESDAPW